MITQDHLDDLARKYNRTKDPELKKLWHEKVKKWAERKNEEFYINTRQVLKRKRM